MTPSPRAALFFILLTVFLDSVGFGIIIPVLPSLIGELIDSSSISDAARWGGWLGLVFAALQFIAAPIIGNLSDRYGRRPLLLGSLFAFSVDFLLSGLAPTIGWLFIARALAGAFAATFSTAAAYIADISTDQNRTHNFGLIGAAFGLGFIVGPTIGGLAGEFGPRVPFFVASALAFCNCVFGYFSLPESLPPERRRAFDWRRANPVAALRNVAHFPAIIGLLAAMFFFRLAHDSLPAVWPFFVSEQFGFSERGIGLSLAYFGLMGALVMGVLAGRIVPRLGEIRSIRIGLGIATVGFLGFAFATQTWMLFTAMTVFSLGGIASASLQSVMARQVSVSQQGELQGAIASLQSVTMILAPLLMTQLFSHFTSTRTPVYFPGVAYFTAALLTAISLAICWRALRHVQPTLVRPQTKTAPTL